MRNDIGTEERNEKLERTPSLVRLGESNSFFRDFLLQVDTWFVFSPMDAVDFVNRLDDDSLHAVFDNLQSSAHFLPFGQGEAHFLLF